MVCNPLVSEAGHLVSALVLGQLLLSSFSRISDTPEEQRRPYFVYIDEAQAVATRDMAVWLHESRKAGLSLCLVSQSLSEYDELMRAAVLSAGTLVVYRVSGEEAKTFAASFDHKPTRERVGVEPLRAATVDPLGFLTHRGHPHPVLAAFSTQFLLPLQTMVQRLGTSEHPVEFGCTLLTRDHFLEGRQLLNEALASCMQTGRADTFIPALALMTLGASFNPRMTYVYYDFIRHGPLSGWVCQGLTAPASRYGRADFLADQAAVEALLNPPPRKWWQLWESTRTRHMCTAGPAFVRMVRSLRAVMQVLAKEPLLTETGVYAPRLQQRSYADMENEIANEITQLERFTCKVKLLTSEHTVKTLPAPRGLTGPALAARIAAIKERMVEEGLLRPVQEVLKQAEERRERLRAPASRRSGSGRPPRPSEPPSRD